MLANTLPFILNQDFKDFELVIIDNGSTDNTPDITAEFMRHDKRITLHRNPVNRGIVPVHNQVIRFCSGTYFAFASDDDYWEPFRLSAMVDLIGNGDGVSCAATGFICLDNPSETFSDQEPVRLFTNKTQEDFLKFAEEPDFWAVLGLIPLALIQRRNLRLISLRSDIGAESDLYLASMLNVLGEIRISNLITLKKITANQKSYSTPFPTGKSLSPLDYLQHLILIWHHTVNDALAAFSRPGLEPAWKQAFDARMIRHVMDLYLFLAANPELASFSQQVTDLALAFLNDRNLSQGKRLLQKAQTLMGDNAPPEDWLRDGEEPIAPAEA